MEDENGCGCFGCSGLLLALAAFALYPAINEVMEGTPLTSEVRPHAAKGGEFLEGGGQAAPGQTIKPAGWSRTLSDGLIGLIVGGGALVAGLFAFLAGLEDYQAWKRKKGGKG